jgi:hypothetical protein
VKRAVRWGLVWKLGCSDKSKRGNVKVSSFSRMGAKFQPACLAEGNKESCVVQTRLRVISVADLVTEYIETDCP